MTGYPEQLVARATGVKRPAIVDVRKRRMVKGPDWVMVDGQVCYTAAGLEKLCAALKLDAALVEAEKNAVCAAHAAAAQATPSAAPERAAEASASPGEASASTAERHSPDTDMPAQPVQQSPAGADGNPVPAGSTLPAPEEGARHEVTSDVATPPASQGSEPAGAFARRDPAATAAAQVAAQVEVIAKASEPVDVRVTRPQLPNRRIVHGVRCDNGAHVVVRVRDNKNFVAGLILRAVPVNRGLFFTQVGNPPRWRGDRVGFTRKPSTAVAGNDPTEGDDE